MAGTADQSPEPARRGWSLRRAVRAAARRGWTPVNRVARDGYRSLKSRHPRVADGVRAALWPVLSLGNRVLLGSSHVPMIFHYQGVMGRDFHYQRPLPETGFAPLVTVIVPNYNHAPYLRQRLDSVFGQTYANVEVLLMDDCSTDDSRAILTEYRDRFPDRTRLLFNEANSGGVFRQWEKGLGEARGEIVWIAESDDWCEPDLLETLVPQFENPAVALAYARTEFMGADGQGPVWSMDHYLEDLGADRWRRPWVETAPQAVAHGFGRKNIIPNVSSALFRRPDRLDVLGIDRWRGMRTCGDWMFYLNVIRGGLLAFTPATRSYYRMHPRNTSVGSYSTDAYYREHEAVAKEAARLYGLDDTTVDALQRDLGHHWRANHSGDEAGLAACFDADAIRAAGEERKPNVLMVGYAFCSGGGETFAIQAANQMRAAGHSVTFLDCGQEAEAPGLRAQLSSDVPVVTNLEDVAGIVRDFGIDLVHSHHAWVDNSLLDLLPEGDRPRHVVTLHGMYETIPPRDLDRIVPRMARRVAGFAYIADKNLEPFLSREPSLRDRFLRIDNALAKVPFVARPRSELGLPDDAFVLTVVSRAIPEKGWREAVEAVALARERSGRDVRLVLVGDGPLHPVMAAGGVPDFVTLTGFREDTRAHFAMADMGLLPTWFAGESFPLVLIECLQAGRPMIATALGEIPRMLADPEGRTAGAVLPLVAGRIDIEALAAQVVRFASDHSAYDEVLTGVPSASAKFDTGRMRDAYARLYADALERPLGP